MSDVKKHPKQNARQNAADFLAAAEAAERAARAERAAARSTDTTKGIGVREVPESVWQRAKRAVIGG